jgi:hypothetical protein
MRILSVTGLKRMLIHAITLKAFRKAPGEAAGDATPEPSDANDASAAAYLQNTYAEKVG